MRCDSVWLVWQTPRLLLIGSWVIVSMVMVSLVPSPVEAEKEKGPGFSHLHMRVITMEFHIFAYS